MQTAVRRELATIEDVDEALGHLRQIPPDERGPAWHTFVDRLLELRATQTDTTTPTRQAQ
jgi:heme oxygenase